MFSVKAINQQVAKKQRKGVSTMRRLTDALGKAALMVALSAPVQAFAESGLGQSTIPRPENLSGTPFLQLLTNIINFILGLVGTIAVLMLIWGGFNYLTSAGNSENTKKAKQTIIYAIIGIIIIALSYQIVRFITGTISGL
ncbi:MAG: TrbC/VirB2 family protein [Candidatus Abawacabacteria bacterium]|nr:TrbC/VirB2 family protein [Candidatus Abawacabacteria bacterium]